MDVIVTPSPGSKKVWIMTDRLGRTLGQIARTRDGEFVITAEDTSPEGPLSKMKAVPASLEAAMDEVTRALRGVCQLSSKEG